MANIAHAVKLNDQIKNVGGQLIAVSKKFPPSDVLQVFNAGVNNFGENYAVEALLKIEELKSLDIKWHFIGRVQTGNLNKIVNKFYMIHSLYKIEHVKKINARSEKKQKILLQLLHPKDKRGFGLQENELREALNLICTFEKIDLSGLMFMPPADFKGEDLKLSFDWAKSIFESVKIELSEKAASWNCLSMGMSEDFETALKCGSSHVRIGTAIFGQRERKEK